MTSEYKIDFTIKDKKTHQKLRTKKDVDLDEAFESISETLSKKLGKKRAHINPEDRQRILELLAKSEVAALYVFLTRLMTG